MSISSISPISTTSYSSTNDSESIQLLTQIKKLQSQIKIETQSSDDAVTKQAKIQLLQAQITQFQSQIQAKKSAQNINPEQDTPIQSISMDNTIDIRA